MNNQDLFILLGGIAVVIILGIFVWKSKQSGSTQKNQIPVDDTITQTPLDIPPSQQEPQNAPDGNTPIQFDEPVQQIPQGNIQQIPQGNIQQIPQGNMPPMMTQYNPSSMETQYQGSLPGEPSSQYLSYQQ